MLDVLVLQLVIMLVHITIVMIGILGGGIVFPPILPKYINIVIHGVHHAFQGQLIHNVIVVMHHIINGPQDLFVKVIVPQEII